MSTILIVDDNEPNRYLLRIMLSTSGYEVLEAANGAEAFELARQTLPDLIISDILMPQMDGFALCRGCKLDERLRAVPFVFYTATYTDARDEALAMQLGAVRFIVKPVESQAFLAIVREVLQAHAEGQLAVPALPVEEETIFYRMYNEALVRKLEDKMLDLDRLNRSLAESEERFRNLAENAQDVIYRCELRPRTGFTYVNSAAALATGYTPEELYADPDQGVNLVHPDDRPLLEAVVRGEVATGQPFNLRWVRKDGQAIWTEQRIVPVRSEAGELIAIEGIARDITVRVQRERELEAIAAVSAALRAAQTRAEMLPLLLDHLAGLLTAGGMAIATYERISGEMLIDLAQGAWRNWTGARLQPGEEISSYVMTTGQPYISADVRREPRLSHLDRLEPLYAVACVPLVAHEHTIGAVWAGRRTEFTAAEIRLLTAISDMAANAIHRVALHEETARQLEQLHALQTIDRAITSSLDMHFSLNVILDQAIAQLRADAAGVLVHDPRTLSLNYAARRGFRAQYYEHSSLRLGEGQAGRAALERRLIHIGDISRCEPPFTRLPLLAGEAFVSYIVTPLISKGQLKGLLEVFHRRAFQPTDDWLNFLEALAQQTAIALDNTQLFENLQKSNLELSLAYDATIEGWSRALDLRDRETEGHTLRVTEMTLRLARAANMTEDELASVRRGALLHDIGKMGISDAILLKPGELTAEEWVTMRKHPIYAYDMLAPIAYLHSALDIPYRHHEKWDGSGYPHGLKGEQIPLSARIFAVVDVWDALLSDRPYRAAWDQAEVLAYIKAGSGTHFDPRAVELFLKVMGDEAQGAG